MKSIERRVLALEQQVRPEQPVEDLPLFELARRVIHLLHLGVKAREQLDADAGTIDPERRRSLTEVLDRAKRIAALLARPGDGIQLLTKEENIS